MFLKLFFKFLPDDAILFAGILKDLFPDVTFEASEYKLLIETLEKNLTEMKLGFNSMFISKIIQVIFVSLNA